MLFSGLNFFYFGKIGADYLLANVDPISLFKDGKYLVILQNNSELRSSGGFIGSYATFQTEDLNLKSIQFNTNIYALDRSFIDAGNFVQAPGPLSKFLKGQSWTLKDANYDASFPEAARDIQNFYQKEAHENIDGIIAINTGLIIDLLKITGPIKMDKYNLTITAENFYDQAQFQIEKGYFEDPANWVINEPKGFLKDLLPVILSKSLEKKVELFKVINSSLREGEILFYFNDQNKEASAKSHGWAGQIADTNELREFFKDDGNFDYLYINSNSYSGDKSSIKVKDTIDYKVEKDSTGFLKANLKITKVHTGKYDWPDGPNDTWTRIYVPQGSRLLEAKINEKNILLQDLTVANEFDKTYFGYQVFTNPGQVNVLQFTYMLPFKNASNYNLYIQNQPGLAGAKINVYYFNKILYSGNFAQNLALESKE